MILATRKSPLALWQANYVKNLWLDHYPQHAISLLEMSTEGDRFLEQRLQVIGGKGVFVKELQMAMLRGEAHASVHSLKDVPMELPKGLALAAYLPRASPRDAVVCRNPEWKRLEDLPAHASIGTSSLRREAHIRRAFPKIQTKVVRGNIGTRLSKLEQGECDALILAEAGLERLGLKDRISFTLSESFSLPAAGQGIMVVEAPIDHPMFPLWRALNHSETSYCARAERALSRRLGGSCHVPLAAYATLHGTTLRIRARVLSQDGYECIESYLEGSIDSPESLGMQVAEDLLEQGAGQYLPSLPSKLK
jgi:hydroxymethylbilane synthase